ncbi:MAG: creatininase family protein [Chloroflexi bacterium]|nr:creatininase family protein [Chloroflexota bacterium]MCL5074434.1 creatininase family protein [Chloroflexota bacterium]
MAKRRLLSELTWKEIAAMDKAATIAFIPIGSLEQHGHHLPLGTDTMLANAIVEGICENLDKELSFIVLPTIPIGQSPEHMDFPGTISLRPGTLLKVMEDLCSSLAAHGFKKIVLLNAHGGNTDILKAVSYDLRRRYGLHIFVIDVWRLLASSPIPPITQESRCDIDIHAGEIETSIMMKINPELVRYDSMQDSTPTKFADKKKVTLVGPICYGWSSADVSETGILGEPTKATSEKGEKLLKCLIEMIRDGVHEIATW